MKYEKEYLDYIKKITDTFIQSVTHNSAQPIEEYYTPKYKRVGDEIIFTGYSVDENGYVHFLSIDECPTEYGVDIKRPKDVVEAWMKIENEHAVKWLNKNIITYDEWLKKNQL